MRTLFLQPSSRRKRRWLHWFEGLLLSAGLVCFCWFGYNWLASQTDQIWSNYKLDAELAGEKPTIGGFLGHIVSGQRKEAQEAARPISSEPDKATEPQRLPRARVHVATGENIGRVEIPRLNISAIVRQGVSDKVLSRAVGHVPYTALPGETGNVGLAAHRDTHFRNLRDVKKGDRIRMVTPAGTLEYEVKSLRVVTPSDVEVLDPTPEPSLTLVTCYPFNFIGHAPKRFIVHAAQVDGGQTEAHATNAATPAVPRKHLSSRRRS